MLYRMEDGSVLGVGTDVQSNLVTLFQDQKYQIVLEIPNQWKSGVQQYVLGSYSTPTEAESAFTSILIQSRQNHDNEIIIAPI